MEKGYIICVDDRPAILDSLQKYTNYILKAGDNMYNLIDEAICQTRTTEL